MNGNEATSKFKFISSKEYKKVLEQDYNEIDIAFNNGAFKAVVILAGSVIEAIITDYLIDKGFSKIPDGAKNEQNKTINTVRAGLEKLIEFCKNEKFVSNRTYHMLHSIRDYRNFIHPDKAIREKKNINKEDAQLYRSSLDIIINEISEIRKSEFGATAEQLLDFILHEPKAASLFKHMVQNANNDNERIELITNYIPTQIAFSENRYRQYLNSDGEPTISSDFEYLNFQNIINTIERLISCFDICYDYSPEIAKATAEKFLSVLKFGSESDKHIWNKLFKPDMIMFYQTSDRNFVTDFALLYLKSITENNIPRYLNDIGQIVTQKYQAVKIFDAIIYLLKKTESVNIIKPTIDFLKFISNDFRDFYEESIQQLKNASELESEIKGIVIDILIGIDEYF